jgi:hypothetical protein
MKGMKLELFKPEMDRRSCHASPVLQSVLTNSPISIQRPV